MIQVLIKAVVSLFVKLKSKRKLKYASYLLNEKNSFKKLIELQFSNKFCDHSRNSCIGQLVRFVSHVRLKNYLKKYKQAHKIFKLNKSNKKNKIIKNRIDRLIDR